MNVALVFVGIHLDKFDLLKDGFETQNPYCCIIIIIIYGEIPFGGKYFKTQVKRGGDPRASKIREYFSSGVI